MQEALSTYIVIFVGNSETVQEALSTYIVIFVGNFQTVQEAFLVFGLQDFVKFV